VSVMHTTVIKENVGLLVVGGTCHTLEEVHKLLCIEGIVFNFVMQKSVTGTDCCADSLTGLLSSPVLD